MSVQQRRDARAADDRAPPRYIYPMHARPARGAGPVRTECALDAPDGVGSAPEGTCVRCGEEGEVNTSARRG